MTEFYGYGYTFTLTDGKLEAYGENSEGQLGVGHTTSLISTTKVFTHEPIAKVVVHDRFVFAIAISGRLYATGENTKGQLGVGDCYNRSSFTLVKLPEDEKVVKVSTGSHHTLVLCESGDMYSMGKNDRGQLGLGDHYDRVIPIKAKLKDKVASVNAVNDASLIAMASGAITMCGDNDIGQLGMSNHLIRAHAF